MRVSSCIASVVFTVFLLYYNSVSAQRGKKVYDDYCAGCHGNRLQGASATALTAKSLKNGSDRKSVISVIRNGIAGTEMPKWDKIMSPKDIEAVADYIIKSRKAPPQPEQERKPRIINTKLYKLRVGKWATGIKSPWGFVFVDKHRALINSKYGDLYWIVDGKTDTQKITGTPQTYAYDMVGGMMDIAIDPTYAKNGWVYLAFSHNTSNNKDKNTAGMTKIVRGKISGHKWVDEQVLFQVADSLAVKGGTRWGCKFLFDKEGFLFFTIGDMNRADDAQILSRPSGKVYRINPDGSIPLDNPFVANENALHAIYSFGNRNVQGLAQHPVTGVIYASEHGPQGGDELNILKKGANYGWPVITYGIDYDGSIISMDSVKEGMEQPIIHWTPSIAVSAIEFVSSAQFPKWKNQLLVGALKFEELRRLDIEGSKVKEQEILLKKYGRIRNIKFGPDGALYVVTNSPDAVLRIVPE